MADVKTKLNNGDVMAFLNSVENDQRRNDALSVLKIFKDVTQEEPNMWGASIVGFGSYTYKYASGREGDWMLTGFSPRKQSLTLYIMSGLGSEADLLKKLGPHTSSKACLYIKKLEDVDEKVLRELIQISFTHAKETQSGC